MKTTFKTLMAVAAFAAFATTSCSQKAEENAEAGTENAVDAAGNAAGNAADATANAAEDAVTPDSDGENTLAPENGDTAKVVNRPADGVVEETPKKQ